MINRSARAACEKLLPLYGQGRYGVVPPKALDIADICVLQIRILHHTFGRRHPQRFPPNAASFKEQVDDHCRSEPSQCVQSWQRTFRSAHQGEARTPPSAARVGWERGDRNG